VDRAGAREETIGRDRLIKNVGKKNGESSTVLQGRGERCLRKKKQGVRWSEMDGDLEKVRGGGYLEYTKKLFCRGGGKSEENHDRGDSEKGQPHSLEA